MAPGSFKRAPGSFKRAGAPRESVAIVAPAVSRAVCAWALLVMVPSVKAPKAPKSLAKPTARGSKSRALASSATATSATSASSVKDLLFEGRRKEAVGIDVAGDQAEQHVAAPIQVEGDALLGLSVFGDHAAATQIDAELLAPTPPLQLLFGDSDDKIADVAEAEAKACCSPLRLAADELATVTSQVGAVDGDVVLAVAAAEDIPERVEAGTATPKTKETLQAEAELLEVAAADTADEVMRWLRQTLSETQHGQAGDGSTPQEETLDGQGASSALLGTKEALAEDASQAPSEGLSALKTEDHLAATMISVVEPGAGAAQAPSEGLSALKTGSSGCYVGRGPA